MSGDRPLRVERVALADTPGDLAALTLDRPEVLNAVDNALLAALHEALDVVERDEIVRGVVLAAAGRAFCTGMDLKERAGFSDDELRAQRARIVDLVRRIHELPIPTVAAVDGVALGGGFELALACDLIVASGAASFGLPEVRVGIFPGGGSTQTLTWLVGPARARDVILTGRRLSAAEAEAWGVVARVVEAGRAREAALELASSIAQGAPLGIRQAKAAIRGAHRALADGLVAENELYEVVLTSRDRVEGFRAFAEKRKPLFEGR
jgi:enoyl-CoA hydratase/carnithine racemase